MIDAMNSQKDADKILKRVRNISERIVPNAIVYGISGADELTRRKTAGQGYKRVLRNSVFPVRAVFAA